MIHPLAGVLSAYGMGLADVRVVKQTSVEAILEATLMPRLTSLVTICAVKGLAAGSSVTLVEPQKGKP